MEHSRHQPQHRLGLLLVPPQRLHRLDGVLQAGLVSEFPQRRGASLPRVVIVIRQLQPVSLVVVKPKLLLLLLGHAPQHLVENVIVPLPRSVEAQPDLFEEVRLDAGSQQRARAGESQLDVFTKAGGVVIPQCTGVPERLEDGVGLEDALHHGEVRHCSPSSPSPGVQILLALLGLGRGLTGPEGGEVEHDDLGRFGLAGSGFA
mmetsp:Transcript_21963/g.64900  ORF Transcript_21963/g.64900 Transcript_21963/m.64900 type:complete len:204 (+) Transcript_21963:4300-4911(+)